MPAIEYADGVTPAVAAFVTIQAGGIISVDEMYKKLFDRVVVGGDLGGLPAIEQFDPRFWQALQSVLEVKSKERVMYNGPATEDASRASILATEVSALRKAHSKRMTWRRWDAKVGDQVVQARLLYYVHIFRQAIQQLLW